MMTTERFRDERGASLALVMALLSFFGVFGVAVVSLTGTSFSTTSVVRSQTAELYAADGGLEYAVGSVTADSTRCARPNTTYAKSISLNNRPVDYSCAFASGGRIVTGSPLLGGEYIGVLTGDPGYHGMFAEPGGTALNLYLKMAGSLHVQGGFWGYQPSQRLRIDGDLTGDDAACLYAAAEPTTKNIIVNGACRSGVPTPTIAVPQVTVPVNPAPAPRNLWGCQILYPGKYTSPPTFSWGFFGTDTFMASGTYYFTSGEVVLSGNVFGGDPPSGDAKMLTHESPCSNDAWADYFSGGAYDASATSKGVTIVLGGTARLKVEAGADVELYTRTGMPAGDANGVSVITAGSGTFSALDPSTDAVFHGLVYMPNSVARTGVIQNLGASKASLFHGGFVFKRLSFAFGSDDNKTFPLAGDQANGGVEITPRVVTISATAPSPGGGSTTVTARLAPDGATPVISNWRRS